MRYKKCNGCNKKLPYSDFSKNKNKSDGLQARCRSCCNNYAKNHYNKNKDYYIDKASNRKKEVIPKVKLKIVEYLNMNPCVDCGNNDIRVLQFDHIIDKKYYVVKMMWEGYSWNSIKKEIDKCEVRCANCHFIKTWPNRFN